TTEKPLMHWQRAALEERLTILHDQLHEHRGNNHEGLADWLDAQIKALTLAADCSRHGAYVACELDRMRSLAAD
ncbi:MAG: hypothetical protein JWL98_178, partial [Xanthomonadaceae bacterium]|nr:hypothetical protein [Xanthomonadaceae bacterium]